MNKNTFITILLTIVIIGLIYIAFFKDDNTNLYKDRLLQFEKFEKGIYHHIDSLTANIHMHLDSLEAIKVERTIIKNNYIGVSNEVDNITTLDSVNSFIRGRMQLLGGSRIE